MSAIVLPLPVRVVDPPRSRPLPSVSTSGIVGSLKPLPALPNQAHRAPPKSQPSTSRASLAPAPSGSALTRGSLGSVLQVPRILSRFLRYVPWHDFQSLALTCSACSNVLQHPKLRNAVLSRFVPGYRYCLRHADVGTVSTIDVQFSDLSHFSEYNVQLYETDNNRYFWSVVSQQLPLHCYPTHALTTLSSSDAAALEERIQRFVMLCQAHSRMVLILQALIHSSSSPVPEELEDPSSRYRSFAQQGGRELVFPAPLFVSNNEGSKANAPVPHREPIKFLSMPSSSGRVPRPLKAEPPRRSLSVISILRRTKVPPPPPSETPLGLKIYSGSWKGRRRMSRMPSEDNENPRASRRSSRNAVPRTDSSGSSSMNSQGMSSPQSTYLSDLSPITVTIPHDIRAATSRLRAPILRVFFPCSKVDRRTITACEAQLEDAGLWPHLSVGDIICNLGYLPPAPAEGAGPSSSDPSHDTASPESWMIFDGTDLLPYTPSATLALSDPLSLPSPFYYTHITFPPVNPTFIAVLPREAPELSLALLPSKLRSPHSPNGVARIKKYQWLARVRPHVRPGLGEGWHGEWILEGEGTKEGRQSLLDALSGNVNVKRVWELVMERCTLTRIWLRCVFSQRSVRRPVLTKTSTSLQALVIPSSEGTSALFDQGFAFPSAPSRTHDG